MDEAGQLALWLAREAVTRYLGERLTIEPPVAIPPPLSERAGVFVTIRTGGALRGCIGTLSPTRLTVAHEIITNAVAAATADPRFPAVRLHELPWLTFEVDRLAPPEPVPDESHLDPARYGVVVEADLRKGVLLPAIEGISTIQQQIALARAKAGIPPAAPVRLYRFAVTRYLERRP